MKNSFIFKAVMCLTLLALIISCAFIFVSCSFKDSYGFDKLENSDGTLTITGIRGTTPESITIPAELEGKKVSSFIIDPLSIPNDLCAKTKEIVIEEGVEFVDIYKASYYITNLERITLPSTIKYIYGGAAADVHINFAGNEYIEFIDNCYVETSTQTVLVACNDSKIPENAKVIAKKAFSDVTMSEFVLPQSLERIEDKAFRNANLNEPVDITLGANIKYVGECAFDLMDINTLRISTTGEISGTMITAGKSSFIQEYTNIKYIIFDVKPNIFGNGSKLNVLGGDKYSLVAYYESEEMERESPCWHLEIESDIEGYKKYDPSQTGNSKGTTFISFSY